MTDDLVKRLRAVDHMSLEDCFCQSSLYDQAAARIETLTAERDGYRKALEDIIKDYEPGYPLSHDVIKYVARAALKEIKP